MDFGALGDRITVATPLDPASLLLFVATFCATALVAMRRPMYAAAFLLAVAPFAVARTVAGTELTLEKVALLGLLLGLSTYGGMRELFRGRSIAIVIGLALCATAVTMLTAIPAEFRGPVARETLKALEHALLIAAAFACYRLDPDAIVPVRAFALSGVLVFAGALVEEILAPSSDVIVAGHVLPRLSGPLEGPNQLAGYCELLSAVVAAAYARWRLRWSLPFLCAVSVVALLTFSRTGAAGVALSAAIVAFAVPACARTLIPAYFPLIAAPAIALMRLSGPTYDAGGVGTRMELWNAARRMFVSHPLLGVGAGNYELRVAEYGVPGVRTHANNWYLQALAEGGIALLFTQTALLVAMAAAMGRRVRAAPVWQLAGFAATVVMLFHGFFDDLLFFQKVGSPFMIVAGFGVAAALGPETAND